MHGGLVGGGVAGDTSGGLAVRVLLRLAQQCSERGGVLTWCSGHTAKFGGRDQSNSGSEAEKREQARGTANAAAHNGLDDCLSSQHVNLAEPNTLKRVRPV